jgi:hypothetical protein
MSLVAGGARHRRARAALARELMVAVIAAVARPGQWSLVCFKPLGVDLRCGVGVVSFGHAGKSAISETSRMSESH